MNELRSKINNSYESSDSGGSASVSTSLMTSLTFINIFSSISQSSEQRCRRSSSYDAMEKGSSLANLLIPPAMIEKPIIAPSYDPEYDYYNEYSTTPLVYSWMPIVPGFKQDGSDNLENFEHIMKRLKPQPLDISNNADKQLNSSSNYHFQRLELLDSSKEVTSASFSHQLEDSCNAMDLNISCHAVTEETATITSDLLSFNGKINSTTIYNDNKDDTDSFTDDAEEVRIRNESFELLKKEDSSKMILVNEKSPQAVDETDDDDESDEQQVVEFEPRKKDPEKSLIDCDTFIMDKLQTSLTGQSVPFSIATLPLSLSEMLSTYEKNLPKNFTTNIKSSSLFIPSAPLDEVLAMEWPKLAEVKAHGIMYNRSTDCEDIESMLLRYTDRFIRAETTTSFTHKNGPTSVKKRMERLKWVIWKCLKALINWII